MIARGGPGGPEARKLALMGQRPGSKVHALGDPLALKGRPKCSRLGSGGDPRVSRNTISPFQGLPPNQGRDSRTQVAWAMLGRPFEAHTDISSAPTTCVQQKVRDTLSPSGEA